MFTDRNNAAIALVTLTESRDPGILEEIRTGALLSIVEMARWKHLPHALPAYILARPDSRNPRKRTAGRVVEGRARRIIATRDRPKKEMSSAGSSEMMASTPQSIRRCQSSGLFAVQATTCKAGLVRRLHLLLRDQLVVRRNDLRPGLLRDFDESSSARLRTVRTAGSSDRASSSHAESGNRTTAR